MRKKSILVVLPQFRKTMLGSILPESIVKALYARASHKKNYRKLTSSYQKKATLN